MEDTEGAYHKFVRLRDPWGKGGLENAIGSKSIWNKVVASQQKK